MDRSKFHAKPLLNTPRPFVADTWIDIDGRRVAAETGEPLIDAINRKAALEGITGIPQVCYLPPMGHIGTCDTCIVEINGELVRSCGATVEPGQVVETANQRADIAKREAFDRILENHNLYCTVCDNSNGNCTVHNATAELN
ncbi:MAG: (2Fe-2S)-binding protein, partial [Rhodospirillales bacterium]|nr:(2Fe-2S)-binding protein [Acetobacter sp.]